MMKSFTKWLRKGRRQGAKNRSGALSGHDSSFISKIDWRRVGAVVCIISSLTILMSVHLMPDKISMHPGEISTKEVRAPRSVVYINSEKTESLEKIARQETPAVYDQDRDAARNAAHSVQQTFDRLELARGSRPTARKAEHIDQILASLHPEFDSTFTLAQLRYLLTVPPATFQKLRSVSATLISDAMDREIRDTGDDLNHARREAELAARDRFASHQDAGIVRAVANSVLRPNRLMNRKKTEERQEAAMRAVPPYPEQILAGEKIIGPGEVVTQKHMDQFIALGLLNPRLLPTTGVAIAALAAAMVLLVAYYIRRALPALYKNTRQLSLLAVIVLLSVFGLKVGASLLGLQFSSGQLGYLGMMGVAAAGMLVSLLLDMYLAVLIVALLSVQSGLIMNHEIRFTVMTLMSSLVGILSSGNMRHKVNLPRTTAALAATNVGLVWLLGLLLNEPLTDILTGSAWGVAAGGFATFLFWFGVVMLEKPFGILTHTALLELSAFDRPLLQQLCAVAPGTYAHSMMVGTLAEAGAQAIGADGLLCRVAGYYHDIGKMKRPEFFVENQRNGNIHGRLSPSLSALIIIAHVRDGAELAKENKLPVEIRDIMEQHHGTTLIRYFYHQALMDNVGDNVTPPGIEERFRYPGPKPQTRESAVVMLADTIEAACRCIDKPTPERLRVEIDRLVREKIEDGQFDECPVTFKDIRGIADAFVHVLIAMMHGRITYPEIPRTATGRPMEVSRADLRAETRPISPIPGFEPAGAANSEKSIMPLTDEIGDPDVAREIAAHLGATGQAEYVIKREANADDAHSGSLETAAVPAMAPMSLPLVEPEVLYGRFPGERAESPGGNPDAAPGGTPPAGGGRTGPRRSKHSTDR